MLCPTTDHREGRHVQRHRAAPESAAGRRAKSYAQKTILVKVLLGNDRGL